MAKPRVNLRLSPRVHAQLISAAQSPNVTIAAIVEAALETYFDPARADGRDKALLNRFDQFDLRQAGIEKELALAVEMIAQFVLYWLTATPPLSEADRKIAHALGQRRFDRFAEQVAKKLVSDAAFSERALRGISGREGEEAAAFGPGDSSGPSTMA